VSAGVGEQGTGNRGVVVGRAPKVTFAVVRARKILGEFGLQGRVQAAVKKGQQQFAGRFERGGAPAGALAGRQKGQSRPGNKAGESSWSSVLDSARLAGKKQTLEKVQPCIG
jgi:hypothetical protein